MPITYEDEHDVQYNIILLGDACGKTTILQEYFGEIDPGYYRATLGVEQRTKFLHQFYKTIKLRIWDASGQKELKSIVSSYIRSTHGAFICFDVTNYQSFINVETWLQWFKNHHKQEVPLILIGCKSNLVRNRTVSERDIQALTKKLGLTYLEVPAVEKDKVNQAFIRITQHIHFQSALNNLKPSLQKYFDDYVQKYPQDNLFRLFNNSVLKKELMLKDQYEIALNKLLKSTHIEDAVAFYHQTLDIQKQAQHMFHKERSLFSLNFKSPLAAVLKETLTDLHQILHHVADLSALKEMEHMNEISASL